MCQRLNMMRRGPKKRQLKMIRDPNIEIVQNIDALKQTDRQTDRHTYRQTDRQTGRQSVSQYVDQTIFHSPGRA